jgi:hypothetical protein
MISWLTDKLFYHLGFLNQSLTTLDGIVLKFLILSFFAGSLAWATFYWILNTELVGKRIWWVLFGTVFSFMVFLGIQIEITNKISDGTLECSEPPGIPSELSLVFPNLFFFGLSFIVYFILSSIPQLRGHRLKRIPF